MGVKVVGGGESRGIFEIEEIWGGGGLEGGEGSRFGRRKV